MNKSVAPSPGRARLALGGSTRSAGPRLTLAFGAMHDDSRARFRTRGGRKRLRRQRRRGIAESRARVELGRILHLPIYAGQSAVGGCQGARPTNSGERDNGPGSCPVSTYLSAGSHGKQQAAVVSIGGLCSDLTRGSQFRQVTGLAASSQRLRPDSRRWFGPSCSFTPGWRIGFGCCRWCIRLRL